MTLFRAQPGLLQAFRAGERAALEAVYRAYVRPVDRYLRALARATGGIQVGQASSVADLLQEVFIRAFSVAGRQGYDGVRDYAPYLTTIARNCFIDAVRAGGREVLTSPNELSVTLEADPPQADDWCEPKTSAILNAYVGALDPATRRVYEQRFVLGRSQDEASDALGVSRRVIRTAEDRLRRGLRKALTRAGISLRELGPGGADLPARIPASPVRVRSGS
jgi:RNA polymerase sigma factor (sigma-70 family)